MTHQTGYKAPVWVVYERNVVLFTTELCSLLLTQKYHNTYNKTHTKENIHNLMTVLCTQVGLLAIDLFKALIDSSLETCCSVLNLCFQRSSVNLADLQ